MSTDADTMDDASTALARAEAELRRLRADFGRLLAFVDADAVPLARRAEAAEALAREQSGLIARQGDLIAEQAARIRTLLAVAARAPGWRHPPSGKRRASR